MALSDAIATISAQSVAPKNRVDLLLEKWEGTEDGEVLLAALKNKNITSASLTRAIRQECHAHDVLKDKSVEDWRRANLDVELTGL